MGIESHSTSNIQLAGATAFLSLIGFDRKGSAPEKEKVTSNSTVKVHIGFTVWDLGPISASNKEE